MVHDACGPWLAYSHQAYLDQGSNRGLHWQNLATSIDGATARENGHGRGRDPRQAFLSLFGDHPAVVHVPVFSSPRNIAPPFRVILVNSFSCAAGTVLSRQLSGIGLGIRAQMISETSVSPAIRSKRFGHISRHVN